MEIDVRTITDDEVGAWCAALNTGFLNPAGDVDAEARRPGLCLDRTWGGFDGDTVVATPRSFRSQMTVPGGGALEASAVTAVTTISTHRRRGLASRLMAAELAASVERGEQVSILIAAEWGIYGRFGYGASTEHQTWTVDALAARVRHRPQGTVEYVDRDTARAVAPEVYERHRSTRPGEISRPERFWDIDFGSPGARSPPKLFLTGDPAAESLLWHHLLSLDMTASVRVQDRPADELLPLLLTDARHAQPSGRADFLWIRPLDVAGMLAARPTWVATACERSPPRAWSTDTRPALWPGPMPCSVPPSRHGAAPGSDHWRDGVVRLNGTASARMRACIRFFSPARSPC